MRLVTFSSDGLGEPLRAGLRLDDAIVDLHEVHVTRPGADWDPTPAAILSRGIDALPVLERLAEESGAVPGATIDPASVTLGPCVVAPRKIICIGLNYRRHAAEARMAIPETPILFSKFDNTLIGHGAVVTIPAVTAQADYEIELATVIGRIATAVSPSSALDHVLGYATANDLSARDLQFQTSQWLLGKSLDGFLPIGPDLVTADEVPDPQALGLRTWLNGELRQDSSTADMIFPVADLVAYVSTYMTLVPGDVILTGTPEGVIAGRPDPVWLADGDVVTVEIDGLGRLETTFRAG